MSFQQQQQQQQPCQLTIDPLSVVPRSPFTEFPSSSSSSSSNVGLYDARLERDACGVGCCADLTKQPSRRIVEDALTILARLSHRGACGCEENTGDGAGLLCAMPDAFMRQEAQRVFGVELPSLGRYAVGLVFLSQDAEERARVKKKAERLVALPEFAPHVRLLGWRAVPTNNANVGPSARSREPVMEQLFLVQRPLEDASASSSSSSSSSSPSEPQYALSQRAFEVLLYLLRRRIGDGEADDGSVLPGENDAVFFCSLSTRTIVYKGMRWNRFGQIECFSFYALCRILIS